MADDSAIDLNGALQHWAQQLASLGYEGLVSRYVRKPVIQEFFEYSERQYEVTTEAVASREHGGDIRLLVEVSEGHKAPPREIAARDFIVGCDGTVVPV